MENFMKKLKNNTSDQSTVDKNLKMMSISAIVLIVLFFYTLIKSDNIIHGSSYYIGVGFLFVLLILTFALQKFKDKIRAKIPKNKFSTVLEETKDQDNKNNTTSSAAQQQEQTNTIQPVKTDITFKDVAGIDSIKDELLEIANFLNNPKKYITYGITLPKGVLLIGPPGVGKTMIAKAVANEAGVPFYYQSGASFVNIYVGAGAKTVRELFTVARSTAPSIIFIDEIDAIGKTRGGGSNDERESTLNELLTQMDGFLTNQNQGVMVIAATNKIDILDDALLRAGRFDRRLFLDLPTKVDRKKILELYLKNKKYNFDLKKLIDDTSGFSSAGLATLINEALLAMIKRDGTSLLEDDISLSKQKVQFGKKQLQILSSSQKEILAIYQAGKAYFTKEKTLLFEQGITKQNITYPSLTQLKTQIKKYLAGTVAVEVILNEPFAVNKEELNYSYELAIKIEKEYKMISSNENLLDKLKQELRDEFIKNKDKINKLKQTLLKEEIVVF
jgi:ATP-dependent metalloprotease FtsH